MQMSPPPQHTDVSNYVLKMRGRWQAAEKNSGCQEYVKQIAINKFERLLFFCTVY
jgi:hypothetical protein